MSDTGTPTQAAGATPAELRVRQLLELNKAAIQITGELQLDSLLQRIVDVARDLIRCKYAALGVLGDDGFIARFPTSGISKSEREKLGAPPRGHGLLGVMLRAGRSLRIPEIAKDPRRSGFPPNHPPMTSLLGVPIFVQGKLVGDLYLTDKIGGPEFSEEDEWLVQLLAIHAATALTNAQLHTENLHALQHASRERARSQALLRVTRAINSSVELDEVIPIVVDSAIELLGAPAAAIYLPENFTPSVIGSTEEAQRFVARYSVGMDSLFLANKPELPMQGSVAGRAARSGSTQVVNDTNEEPDTIFPRLAGRELRAVIASPLIIGGRSIGVLSTYSDLPGAFDGESVLLLESLAAVASAAIYNATLYVEARQGREAAEREQQRLREVEQMKDEFLSTAAHELRTPLTTIRMSAGLAHEQLLAIAAEDKTGTIDDRIINLVGLLVEGSERMHSLVNDLLDLTRLEQGRTTLNMEELDLREIVRSAVEVAGPLFNSKQQKLAVRLPETYCGAVGDRSRLEQVVINLLSNAHKYTPPESLVEIRALRSGDESLITVRDNGPGIPESEHELIFDRFFRSSMHRNDRTASTGLGLPIARTITEMHKGRLWAEAAPGGGTIFTVSLPASG